MLYGQIKIAYSCRQDSTAHARAKAKSYMYLGSGGDSHLFQDPKTKEYFEQHNDKRSIKDNTMTKLLEHGDLKAYLKKYYNV